MFRLVQVKSDELRLIKCFSPPELAINKTHACIVQKANGTKEFGYVKVITEESGDPDAVARTLPVILRRATLQDQAQASENVLLSKTFRRFCQEKISEYKLDMVLVRIHYSFDRSLLTVLFKSQNRVDFRQLVKDMTAEANTRIEMRQIGMRDVAALIGALGPCGRPLCCATWLKDFGNVYVRMVKMQGLSLNPDIMNGMCGRLKCCLRFEHSSYQQLLRRLPRKGDLVSCTYGKGKVIDTSVLSQTVKLLFDDNRVRNLDVHDIKKLGSRR